MLQSNEYRIWVGGVPKSQRGKGKHSDGYVKRVQAAARLIVPQPVSTRVELIVVYNGKLAPQLDTDNAAKLIQDALIGIAYHDDRQIKDTRVISITEDELRSVDGQDHLTFARILDRKQFLIRLLHSDSPTIKYQLRTS
jgi:Holliday junction resolvase RusA-like endonuclease